MNRSLLTVVAVLALLVVMPFAGLYADARSEKTLPSRTATVEGEKDTAEDARAGQTKTTPAEAMAGEEINWHVISGGGTSAASTNFNLSGTIGQTAVGSSLAINHTLHHGYWQVFYLGGEECCGMYTAGYTGNTNCDIEGKRNIADIAKLIDRVYISKMPLCCETEGNVNGDIERKMNLADIARLIDHVYLSKVETELCM